MCTSVLFSSDDLPTREPVRHSADTCLCSPPLLHLQGTVHALLVNRYVGVAFIMIVMLLSLCMCSIARLCSKAVLSTVAFCAMR